MIPKGKGIYGRSRFLDKTYSKFLQAHGIEHYVPISTARLQRQVDVGAEYGITVHGGDIPHPNGSQAKALAALDVLARDCTKAGVGSMEPDMEEGVFWNEDFCRRFIARARDQYEGTLGVTCYGSHRGKLAGMEGADYYLDQAYDRYLRETADQRAYFLASLAKFERIAGDAPIGLGLGAFLNYTSAGKRVTTVKPLERFKRHIAGVPKKTTFVMFWTLPSFQMETKRFAAWWDAIGELELR